MNRGIADRLLLLSPSEGFGGGIERVARALEAAWRGPVRRVSLYRRDLHTATRGQPRAKARFVAEATLALRQRPDVVLTLHVGLLPAALPGTYIPGVEVGLVALGTEVWAPMPSWQRRLVRRCDRIFAISSFTGQWISCRARLNRRRVSILWLPIDEGLAARALGTERFGNPSSNILTVSRIDRDHRYKGHFDIAASLPQVLERRPDTRWIVVGDGNDLPALRDRCNQLGIAHAVRFLGAVSDTQLAETYASAATMVLPSTADAGAIPPRGEGFGLVYAEAGAFGVPSIGSRDGGGSADFVVDGRTGLTVPPNETVPLATAILRLLDDQRLRDELGSAARSLVRERHSPSSFSQRLEALFSRPACKSEK